MGEIIEVQKTEAYIKKAKARNAQRIAKKEQKKADNARMAKDHENKQATIVFPLMGGTRSYSQSKLARLQKRRRHVGRLKKVA